MIVSTETSDARLSSATTLQHTSRSVTTPTTFWLVACSSTGAQPHPELRIAAAACAAVSLGPQHEAAVIGSITSPQQPMFISSRVIVGECSCDTVCFGPGSSCANESGSACYRSIASIASPTPNGLEHTKSNGDESEPEQPPQHVHAEEMISVIKVKHVLSPEALVAEEGRVRTFARRTMQSEGMVRSAHGTARHSYPGSSNGKMPERRLESSHRPIDAGRFSLVCSMHIPATR
jgi:hypothetical protein